jgi:NAD/NADP transhydrogenase alpha subunit
MDLATLFGSLTLGHGVLGVALIAVYHLAGWLVSKWSVQPSVTPAPQTSLGHDFLVAVEAKAKELVQKGLNGAAASILHPALHDATKPADVPAK